MGTSRHTTPSGMASKPTSMGSLTRHSTNCLRSISQTTDCSPSPSSRPHHWILHAKRLLRPGMRRVFHASGRTAVPVGTAMLRMCSAALRMAPSPSSACRLSRRHASSSAGPMVYQLSLPTPASILAPAAARCGTEPFYAASASGRLPTSGSYRTQGPSPQQHPMGHTAETRPALVSTRRCLGP